MDRESIRKEAKRIMDNFARALEKVKVEESRVERKEERREEVVLSQKEPKESEIDSDFRKIMFENAPNKENECIKAEKGGWVE